MPTLLLELFSEEIPARMQHSVPKALRDNLLGKCVEASLASSADELAAEIYVTPRRVAIKLSNLPERQPDITIEKKGPKTSAPEKAIEGFLRGAGLKLEDLEKRQVGKDEVYFSITEQKGKPTAELLKGLIEESIGELVWPKSMRWGDTDARWVRPLHSICCLLDSEVIPIKFGHITASNTTHGHRFLAPDEITISHPDEYVSKLEAAKVLAEQSVRIEKIRGEITALADAKGLKVRTDEALLSEVAGLIEWPVALVGKIEDRFMKLPHELLQVTMASHQKYFTLEDTDGNISPYFIFAANRSTDDDGSQIIAGNERVLRARFSDAEFFFSQDQKNSLTEWSEGLSKVTFHAKLGTVAEKVERVEKLAATLSNNSEEAAQAAKLCKADLVTGMVGEFPELQGIIGSYYAKAEGMASGVAEALYHLYDHPSDLKNLGKTAQALCMADRLDTLISLFSIDEKPTGSKDPFALRRAALGVIAIIRNHDIRMQLGTLFPEAAKDDLLSFFNDRLEADLREQKINKNTLKAIGGLLKDDDLVRVTARAKALQDFLGSAESEAMLAAYKRAKNILSAEEKKDKTSYKADGLSQELLGEAAEKDLYEVLSKVTTAIKPLAEQENFTGVMAQFATLKAPLDSFFNDIMVNADDADLRKNRLCLLAAIVDSMHQVADFSELTS